MVGSPWILLDYDRKRTGQCMLLQLCQRRVGSLSSNWWREAESIFRSVRQGVTTSSTSAGAFGKEVLRATRAHRQNLKEYRVSWLACI
jgi:hypothetical protein